MSFISPKTGINWNYELKGNGQPLILMHSWAGDHRIWRSQVEHFSLNYSVLAPDLPGHGKSSWASVGLKEIAEDLQLLCQSLNMKSINYVGSSFGGLVGLKLYDLFPGMFNKFVLAGSLPKFLLSDDFPFGLPSVKIEKLKLQLDSDYPSIVNIFIRSLFVIQERETARYKWLVQFSKNDHPPKRETLKTFLDILAKEDLRSVMPKMKVPVQIINGKQDYIISVEAVNAYKTLIPNARVDFMDNCGHFPFVIYAREFNQLLEEFLNGN